MPGMISGGNIACALSRACCEPVAAAANLDLRIMNILEEIRHRNRQATAKSRTMIDHVRSSKSDTARDKAHIGALLATISSARDDMHIGRLRAYSPKHPC